jgi:hypothetical protein
VIHAKHREAPLRNGAPNDGDGNAEHGLTVRPGAGKLSSDARVVYKIVLRFIPPEGEQQRGTTPPPPEPEDRARSPRRETAAARTISAKSRVPLPFDSHDVPAPSGLQELGYLWASRGLS